MDHVGERTPGQRVGGSPWPLVHAGVAEADDADDVAVVGDPELTTELELAIGNSEVPASETGVDSSEEQQHAGHRGVGIPELHWPGFGVVKAEGDLVRTGI